MLSERERFNYVYESETLPIFNEIMGISPNQIDFRRCKLRKHVPHHYSDTETAKLQNPDEKQSHSAFYFTNGDRLGFVKQEASCFFNMHNMLYRKTLGIYPLPTHSPFKKLNADEIKEHATVLGIGQAYFEKIIITRTQNPHLCFELNTGTLCNALILAYNKKNKWHVFAFKLETANFLEIDEIRTTDDAYLNADRRVPIANLPSLGQNGENIQK